MALQLSPIEAYDNELFARIHFALNNGGSVGITPGNFSNNIWLRAILYSLNNGSTGGGGGGSTVGPANAITTSGTYVWDPVNNVYRLLTAPSGVLTVT